MYYYTGCGRMYGVWIAVCITTVVVVRLCSFRQLTVMNFVWWQLNFILLVQLP